MRAFLLNLLGVLLLMFIFLKSDAQLVITTYPNAQALAQRLVGDGVSISNVSFTGNRFMASFFLDQSNSANIGIDSGIVLTTGRAKTTGRFWGVDGNGTDPASTVDANGRWGLPGDNDLGNAIGNSGLKDACVLEFDFVPLGDSIRFNYVFSSEEYLPNYVCTFNDAFAFFISGPGITGLKNIALIPNTNTPVSILNVNDVPGGNCPNNIPYYIDNRNNTFFTHEGHTTVLTARESVQPCQTYHLKLVLADAGDDMVDTGVFLEAKSLSSSVFGISNLTQTDPNGNSYLVEGCATGAFTISRPRKDPYPLTINLSYGGQATNGIDMQTLPLAVVIPANDSFVTVNVIPLMDGLSEGIETIKVFALAGCAAGLPTDSTFIQIRDYDILQLTPDTARVCQGGSIQLNASPGYTTYQWNADPSLSSLSIPSPIATPVNPSTNYICTATVGTCQARDSVYVERKKATFLSKTDERCRGSMDGSLQVSAGFGWIPPVQYSLDGTNWQNSSIFTGLAAGTYTVKVRDPDCTDSVAVTIDQTAPDLQINTTLVNAASCSGNPDGQLSMTVLGGTPPYLWSADGINFQASAFFNLNQGNYTITVKDVNGCLQTRTATIPLINTVTIDAGTDTAICEGKSFRMNAVSNATTFNWLPTVSVNNSSILNPQVNPVVTTKYYVTATSGICSNTDTITIQVWPAPVADAGTDISDCFGKIIQLNGSGGASYQWTPATYFTGPANVANPSLKATASMNYYLAVTDTRGCQSLQDDVVRVNVTPAVRIDAGRDTVAAMNQPIQLRATELSSAGVIRYSWTSPQFLNNPAIANPVATLPNDFRYTVTGTTADGCEGVDELLIKVYKGPEIYIPSGFTPDRNGLNDLLKAFPVGIKEFHYFRVFNRWGQLVFQTKDPGKGWDGTINGTPQPIGSYVWMAEAVDYLGRPLFRKGTVTIIR